MYFDKTGIAFLPALLLFVAIGKPLKAHEPNQPNQELAESPSAGSDSNAGPIDPPAQSCTWGSLLSTSNCGQTWGDYKDGYRACVENAAKFFWRNYACSADALEKLQRTCRRCEAMFAK